MEMFDDKSGGTFQYLKKFVEASIRFILKMIEDFLVE
jgi:hypothetical protein